MKPVRIAIVDDARFIREALQRVLSHDARVRVVGAAATGEELLDNLDRWQPDVVTLDLAMPGLGGLDTLDALQARRPVHVIILSTHSGEGAPMTLEALSRGAADFIDKESCSLVDFQAMRELLVGKIMGLAGVAASTDETPAGVATGSAGTGAVPDAAAAGVYDAVFIGASTGGPGVIERILADIGPGLSVPIVIVQHMPPGFTQAFAMRLDRLLPIGVREPVHGETLRAGQAYVAKAGTHLRVRGGSALVAMLSSEPAVAAHRPSVDELFHSAAQATGARTLGVLLTGMGQDGAEGLLAIARAGGYTIAQDADTSVVYGMPRAAVELGAARQVLAGPLIGGRICDLVGARSENARTAPAGTEPPERPSSQPNAELGSHT